MTSRTEPEIWVPISLGQAERVVQQIVGSEGSGASLVRVLLALGGQDRVVMADLLNDPEFNDRYISQTLVVSLMVLSAFHGDVEQRVSDLADELGTSRATTVRYLKSWVAVGVLEQSQVTRKYRLALRWRTELAARNPLAPIVPSAI